MYTFTRLILQRIGNPLALRINNMKKNLPFSDCSGCNTQSLDPISYCKSSCGYALSPGYPFSYGKNSRLTWHISVSVGKYVALIFPYFDIYEEPLKECSRDFITLEDRNLEGDTINLGR